MARAFTDVALSAALAAELILGLRIGRPVTALAPALDSVQVTKPSPPCEKWHVWETSPPPSSLDVTAASLRHFGHCGSTHESLHCLPRDDPPHIDTAKNAHRNQGDSDLWAPRDSNPPPTD